MTAKDECLDQAPQSLELAGHVSDSAERSHLLDLAEKWLVACRSQVPACHAFYQRDSGESAGRPGLPRIETDHPISRVCPSATGPQPGKSEAGCPGGAARLCPFTATIGRHFLTTGHWEFNPNCSGHRSAATMRPTDGLWPGLPPSSQAVRHSGHRASAVFDVAEATFSYPRKRISRCALYHVRRQRIGALPVQLRPQIKSVVPISSQSCNAPLPEAKF
jgi:hypothetical protein